MLGEPRTSSTSDPFSHHDSTLLAFNGGEYQPGFLFWANPDLWEKRFRIYLDLHERMARANPIAMDIAVIAMIMITVSMGLPPPAGVDVDVGVAVVV